MGCQAGGLACELIVGQLEKPQVGQDWEALERSDVAAVQAEDAQVDKRHKLQAEPFQAELFQAGHGAPRKEKLGHSARWLACSLRLDGLLRVHVRAGAVAPRESKYRAKTRDEVVSPQGTREPRRSRP